MTDLYTQLVARCLFPLHERLKRHTTTRVLRRMETQQWWPAEKIAALQSERLRCLVDRAYRQVPYYRRLFDERGLGPGAIRCAADLPKLPFLTKELIRTHQESLKADDAQGLARFNTGGSSGEPLIFFIGRERVSHDVAAKWRATRWWDVDIGDPEIVVWGSPIELGAQGRLQQMRDRLLRTRLLPAFEMSEQKLAGFIDAIRRMRPRMLFGYPSALALIAGHAESQGQRLDNLGIRVAFTTSERLYDHQREQITQVFGCPVANGYGGRDAGFLAHECPKGGMHITADDLIIEIVDGEGRVLPPGEAGEVVVTHLATGDYPFIRYRTGDIAVLSERRCPCGRGLPLLEEIQGRTTDFVVSRNGTVMHGLALIYVVRDLPGVREFKIVQESLDLTRILLVADKDFPRDAEQTIVRGFKQRLGEEVDIRVEWVKAIPKEASGKFRYVVSHVAPMDGSPGR